MPTKTRSFKAGPDDPSVDEQLQAIFTDCKYIQYLKTHRGPNYTSRDMKVGIVAKSLVLNPALVQLFLLDKRGGFFRQKHVYAALNSAMNENEDDALVIATISKSLDMSVTEFLKDAAYTCRVQCSHGREKYFHWIPTSKPESDKVFKAIFDAMASVRADGPSGRATKKVCPFYSFREPESSESSTDDDAVVVGVTYDPSARIASMRMSYGSMRPAESYVSGDDGFIKAEWSDPKLSYQLEVADTYLEADGKGIKKLRVIPAASTTVKKAKTEKTKSPAAVALKGKGKPKGRPNPK